jgi:hypothetical protein
MGLFAPDLHPMKLSIALVSHDTVPITFAYDLANMVAYTIAGLPENVEVGVNLMSGTYVHSARQQLLHDLLEQNVTHILWVDTDMRFPRDACLRLLKHQEPFVGINYAKRCVDTEFVAIKKLPTKKHNGERLITSEKSTGLEEVEGIGFGLVLMRTSALNLPPVKDGPWFWFEWLPGGRQVGEDIYFCRLVRKTGVRIFVDHDLSKECAHIGQFEFSTQHACYALAQKVIDAREAKAAG